MNTLKITVSCDRKAALLNGLVLGETCEVEVSPETIGAEWPALVAMLDMSGAVPSARAITVAAPTAEAVKSWLDVKAAERADSERETTERHEREVAAMESGAENMERMLSEPLTATRIYVNARQADQHRIPSSSMYNGVKRDFPYVDWGTYGKSEAHTARANAAIARRDAVIDASKLQVEAANQSAFEAALPALLQVKADADEAARLAEIAKKEALEKRKAARLESGMWTKETGSYNEKRYGAWWVASVDFSSGAKGDYTFGQSSGNWGKAGELSVTCRPGDFIAYGQKDLRRPDKSDHFLARMRDDGSMENFDSKADAYRAFKTAAKKVAA